jgi:MtN3 and saliva related transmembrane protein
MIDPREYLGYSAAILTTGSFVPQAVRAFRAGNRDAISTVGMAALTAGNVGWLAYGLTIGNRPMAIANIITTVLCGAILLRKAMDKLGSPSLAAGHRADDQQRLVAGNDGGG